MHSPLRRQLARRQSRSPTKTPRRLQQEPTRQGTPEQSSTWRSQNRDVHLTPERAAPKPQRAWERKPRAGQKGKIVWKRPQHELPKNQLRSKPSSSAAGALADKTNTTPQKVIKKARLDAKSGIPAPKDEPLAKPLHWDRRSSGLIHKAPMHQTNAREDVGPEADQENLPVACATSSRNRGLESPIADTDVDHEVVEEQHTSVETPSPQLPFTYGVPSSDDLSELTNHGEVATDMDPQAVQSSPSSSSTGSQDDEQPEMLSIDTAKPIAQPDFGAGAGSAAEAPEVEEATPGSDGSSDPDATEQEVGTQTDAIGDPTDQVISEGTDQPSSAELDPVEEPALHDESTYEQATTTKETEQSSAEKVPEEDDLPAAPMEQPATDVADSHGRSSPAERPSPTEHPTLINGNTGKSSDDADGKMIDPATKATEEAPALVDSTRAEDFDIVPDLPNRFTSGASATVDHVPFPSPARPESTAAFGTPLASRNPPPTPGSTTVKIALNDDESILHDFISRTKASKAARIAKRSSDANKRESDLVKKALASPGRVGEALLEVDSPSEGKARGAERDASMNEDVVASPTLSLDPSAVAPSVGDSAQGTSRARRSKRKQPNPSEKITDHDGEAQEEDRSAPPSGPVTFSLRRRGDEGEKFALKKTEAQEWSMMTRSNTRRNKAGAVPVKAVLTRLRGGEITPEEAAAMYAGEGDVPDGQGQSTVRWNEQLVKFFEESMTSNKGLDEEVDVLSQLAGKSQPSTDAARPRARRAKALGAMNGTPAKSKTGKIVLDHGDSAAPSQEETKKPASKPSREDKAKRTHGASESQPDAEKASDHAESSQRPTKQARRLPAPTIKAATRGDAADEPAGEEKKPVRNAAPRAAAAAKQTRAAAQAGEDKQGKASGLRSGLPTRRGVRSRT